MLTSLLHDAESMTTSLVLSAPLGTRASRSSQRPSLRPPGYVLGAAWRLNSGAPHCPQSMLPWTPLVRQHMTCSRGSASTLRHMPFDFRLSDRRCVEIMLVLSSSSVDQKERTREIASTEKTVL